MHYFIANKKSKEKLFLDKNESFHFAKVLRIKRSEVVYIRYDKKVYVALFNNNSNKIVECKIIKEHMTSPSNKNISIILPLCKNTIFKSILRKVTEIGVKYIYVYLFENCSVSLKNISAKLEIWNKIIIESAKQSNNFFPPKIQILRDLRSIENINNYFDLKILCYEKTDYEKKSLSKTIKNAKSKNIVFVIGPEGGIANDEVSFFKINDYLEVSLSKNILKIETACLYCLIYLKEVFL